MQVAFAQIRTRTDTCNVHFPHVTLHMHAINIPALKAKFLRDSAASVDWMSRVVFINSVLGFTSGSDGSVGL